jgi:DNA-binding transcriptional LysR family regulator
MDVSMLDIELLRSFVSVVDAGGFTRAGERVHRTQSTVSQQIRRLEDAVGKPLLLRDGKRATPTEEGERLLGYARRILALAQEAHDVVARPMAEGVVRVGLPEDFAAYRLVELLSDYVRSRPTLRLDMRSGLSATNRAALERGELDVALLKRRAGSGDCVASWPERLQWVTSRRHPVDLTRDPVPLAVSEQGCLYRNSLIHALEQAGRSWHIAYTSPNLSGIQAAVAVGLGIAILPDVAVTPEHRIVDAKGFTPIDQTELALIVSESASPAARKVAELIADLCNTLRSSKAA